MNPAFRLAACCGLLFGCAGGASAQSVVLYGVVDIAVEHVGQVGAGRSGLNRMPGLTGSVPSRWGLRGGEDLGGGLRAVFTLEGGLMPDTGALGQGGRGFGRQAWVGLQGPWGTLGFGRQNTMLFWSLLDADVMGPALYGTGSLDAYIPNARADNAVAWQGRFGKLTIGATYSLGRDAVDARSPAGTNCAGEDAVDAKACRGWSALLKHDTPGWGVALAVDQFRGGAGAFAGLSRSALEDRRVSANGYLRRGAWKATLGLIDRDNAASATAARSALWYAGLAWAAAPSLTLEAQWLRLRFKGSADGATLGVLRASVGVSRRTALYAMAARMANAGGLALSVSGGGAGSSPLAGGAQSAVATGVRHAF